MGRHPTSSMLQSISCLVLLLVCSSVSGQSAFRMAGQTDESAVPAVPAAPVDPAAPAVPAAPADPAVPAVAPQPTADFDECTIDAFLTSDTTEQEIIDFAKEICNPLGLMIAGFEATCPFLIEAQLPAIIEGLVADNLDPTEVCTDVMGACPSFKRGY